MSSESDSPKSATSQQRVRRCTPRVEHVSTDVFRVGVRIPPFWPEKPAIWFAQIEGQFSISRISDDTTKFYYVIGQLDNQYAAEVEDIITAPPETDKYTKLKCELIKRLSVSKENKVKQLLMHEELGDRKPSQFLRHLRSLAGPSIPEDFLKTIWSSRLPSSMQPIIASQSVLALDALADLADHIADIASSMPHVASTSRKSNTVLDTMTKQIAELTRKVTELSATVNQRSRSRTRQPPRRVGIPSLSRSQSSYRKYPTCWYHKKFGSKAKRCVRPCDYISENTQGSR